jgi:hypothetical protein
MTTLPIEVKNIIGKRRRPMSELVMIQQLLKKQKKEKVLDKYLFIKSLRNDPVKA